MEVYEDEISSAEAYHSRDFQWESLRDEVEGLLERTAKQDETSAPTLTRKRPQKKDADCTSSMIPWEAFYTRHSRNIFFKERRYLTKEFPELSRAFQTEENNKPLRVLEIGCGTGSSVLPVLRANKEAVVYACDCSAAALRKAIEVVSTLNGSTFFPFMCDISLENLPSFLCRPPCDRPHSHVTKMFTELPTLGVKQMDIITLDDEEDGSDPDICTGIENSKKLQFGGLGGPALLPVCDGGLDIVTMIFTLSAIPVERMAHVLSECFAVLKPGGLLLFRDYGLYDMTMLRFAPWQRISDRLYQRQDGTLSYFFSLEVVREIFTKAGFMERELEYCCVQLMNRRKEVPMKRVWVHAKFQKPLT